MGPRPCVASRPEGADLVVVQILGPGELDPAVAGDVDLVDIETGRRLPLSLTEQAIERYETSAVTPGWTRVSNPGGRPSAPATP